MRIPYGIADFGTIRRGGNFYVDKTPFLAELERPELRNLVFLRPRRMGKSSLLSMMAHYYDLGRTNQFDELFRGLWVHEHPTPEKNAHVVLHLNFGKVAGSDETQVRTGFRECVLRAMATTLPRLVDRSPTLQAFAERMDSITDATGLIDGFMGIVQGLGLQLYVLIDEYDTFANSLISMGSHDLYSSLTAKTGFVRSFYRALKAGVDTGGIARTFITGVAPLLLDDLYTGFNITTSITTDARFNALAGFTHADVERAVDEFFLSRPELMADPQIGHRQALLALLEQHYDGYRFSDEANEHVFNSDMVLYFLKQLEHRGAFPRKMLDPNARTDYRKFYGIFEATGEPAKERRKVLHTVLNEGGVIGELLETFGREPSPAPREQFISLLFYTGMLTLKTEPRIGRLNSFEVPNLVIRNLQWEHFSAMLTETVGIRVDPSEIVLAQQRMAQHGDVAPFIVAIHEHVMKVLGTRDMIDFDEKALKMILITSAVMSGIFHVLSEKEFAQGFTDLFMSPRFDARGAKYSWLIELKYLKAKATEKQIAAAFAEADAQLGRYAHDKALVPLLTKDYELKSIAMVFVGAKEIRCRMWPKGDASEIRVPAKMDAEKQTVKKKLPPKKK